ncbi:putative ATP-dependent RNA helicase DHX40 [Liparis tanakae]|uniref:RNA helicase n=1 Tax=Liparis tanakae TaxID=230148 RepID=A0A4Z2H3P6_9TELE|nr:putative ATP-dependent RNA helicase DHX40 [Liparis tanakae]
MSKSTRLDSKENESKRLPIYRHKDELVLAVKDSTFLAVTGETGSGKTTQLPKYLHQAGFCKNGKIGITQPRRVAAITVAQRVAQEMQCTLGREVGYQVRFDDCTSQSTVVKYMTDGCLLREILADPVLSQYSVVILDEVHERSLNTDILLGLLKKMFSDSAKAIKGRSFPLKVVVMSATLETEKLSAFLSGCQAEIERACDMLYEKAETIDYRYDVEDQTVEGLLILPLYGSMPTDQQRQIFQPPPSRIRKCVVATNIAATSLTINGIKYIIDSGFVKQLNHNSRVGMDILEVVPISKSEGEQRAGRAGRTSAGKCFRIYTKEFWEKSMPDYTVPEIQRTSLTAVILTLKCLGVHDVIRFPYMDCPEERFILEALKQLYQFDAIDRRGRVTQLGKLMVEFPLHPGLTRAVLKAASLGCEDLLLPVAAMLSVENIFIRPGHPEKQKEADAIHKALATGSLNDFATLLNLFDQEGKLNWVIFHDVLVTSRVYVRTACPIRYEWVKDLLPKLHEVDVYELSSVAREEVTDEEMTKWENKEAAKRQPEVSTEDVVKKLEKRNDEAAVGDARARYMQRKQQRQPNKAP